MSALSDLERSQLREAIGHADDPACVTCNAVFQVAEQIATERAEQVKARLARALDRLTAHMDDTAHDELSPITL